MIGLDRIGSEIDDFGIEPIVPQAGPRMHVFAQVLGRLGPGQLPAGSGASGTVTSATSAPSAATRSAGARWRLTP